MGNTNGKLCQFWLFSKCQKRQPTPSDFFIVDPNSTNNNPTGISVSVGPNKVDDTIHTNINAYTKAPKFEVAKEPVVESDTIELMEIYIQDQGCDYVAICDYSPLNPTEIEIKRRDVLKFEKTV